MSLLPSATFANPSTPFYAAVGSGGSASTLQSPASITPSAVDGSVSLSVIQSTGSANPAALLTVASNNGNDAVINLAITPTGNTQITMGVDRDVALTVAGTNRTLLHIGGANDNLTVDVATNAINLGYAGAAGVVNVNTGLIYTAAGGPPSAGFSALVLRSGITPIGATVISVASLPTGLYVVYGQAGSSTDSGDLSARFSTVISMGAAGLCQGGGYAAVAGAYTVAPGTASLTLTLNAATTAAYSVVAYPIYLF